MTKLAIITGSSRGLGFSIAEHLLSKSWDVIGLSRTHPSPANSNSSYKHFALDLGKMSSHVAVLRDQLFQQDIGKYSEVYFIHNASLFWPVGLLPNLKLDEIECGFSINITSAVILSQMLISFCDDKKVPLKMAFISSPAASIGIAGASVYCAAKAGLESLMKSIHSETPFYRSSVKCLSFMPGRIDTEMQKEMRTYSKEVFPSVDRYRDFHEKGQLQDPGVVAKLFCENLVEKDFESGRAYSIAEF